MRFELHFGNTMQEAFEDHDSGGDHLNSNTTPEFTPISNDNEYWFLELDDQHPCLNLMSSWPDFRKRLYLRNMIFKITEMLVRFVAN